MTEREARRLMDTILDQSRSLRVDWIGPSFDLAKWELVVTDTSSASQFLVTHPSQLCEYLRPSESRPPDRTDARQGLLF